jgi:hypothetical protein
MSFERALRAELARVGIRGVLARRIEAELADHRRCDPAAPLGDPRELADRFAADLRVPLTRRAVRRGFAALSLAAALLVGVALVYSATDQWAHLDLFGTRGAVVAGGGLAIVIGAQVAFVAGMLALVPIVLGRSDQPSLLLAQRRLAVALVSVSVVIAGELAQTIAQRPLLPDWLFVVSVAAALAPLPVLVPAARTLRVVGGLTPVVPVRSAFPASLLVGVALAAVAAMTLGSAVAERSLAEGLSRGAIEALAIGGCFALLARRLGLRSDTTAG